MQSRNSCLFSSAMNWGIQMNVRKYPKGSEKLEDGLIIKDDSFLGECDWRLKKFYELWMEKHDSYALPSKKDFDPVEMCDLLPYIIMVEKHLETDEFRYRLVGTNEVQFRGMDPTGQLVRDTCAAENPEKAIENYDYVMNQKRPLYNVCSFEIGHRRKFLDQTLFLPTASNGIDVDVVMAISVQVEDKNRD